MAEFSDKDTKEESGYRLPEQTTLYHAAKIAIVEDKPIMMDYWTHSIDKTVSIGVKENNKATNNAFETLLPMCLHK